MKGLALPPVPSHVIPRSILCGVLDVLACLLPGLFRFLSKGGELAERKKQRQQHAYDTHTLFLHMDYDALLLIKYIGAGKMSIIDELPSLTIPSVLPKLAV